MTKKTANTFDPDVVAIFTRLQQWHAGHIETLRAMRDVKDRLVIEAGDQTVTLDGAALTGFKTGVHVALEMLTPWPVTMSDPIPRSSGGDLEFLREVLSSLDAGDTEMVRTMIEDWIDDLADDADVEAA